MRYYDITYKTADGSVTVSVFASSKKAAKEKTIGDEVRLSNGVKYICRAKDIVSVR